ncbi:YciI family protein [Microbulbifer sp. EKSA008]|uniref:YciI family protein n=1 Tax=unclassified Microbulbifer TaxID=2619833 RepID=UPI00403B0159
MFLVNLNFPDIKKLTPELMAEHVSYLEGHYKSGDLLFGGAKEPRTGAIIISRHPSEEVLRKVLEEDPFTKHGASTFTITEFVPVMASEEFSSLLKEP